MKCFPQKIVSILIALFLVHLIEICMLAIVCDCTSILKSKSADTWIHQDVHIQRLITDTISAQEIEIFPLMDLEGNVYAD